MTDKQATPEQLSFINNTIKSLDLGVDWNDFATNMLTESGRQKYSINLASQLRQVDKATSKLSHDGMYQPLLSRDLLKDIDSRPINATSTQIESWLNNPSAYSENLAGVNMYLSHSVGVYKRALWYMNTIKAFNYELTPSDPDITIALEMDSENYMKSYNSALTTLKKLNIKYQLPKIDLATMYDGASFWWMSETKDNITMLQLPSRFCYITSPFTFGYRFAFDLTFFDSYIGMKDAIPDLWNAYEHFNRMREAFLSGNEKYKDAYVASQYYLVPPDKGWCMTFDPIHADKTPPMASSMGSALDVLSYRSLLKNQLALNLFKLIPLKIPVDKQTGKPSMDYGTASIIVEVIRSVLPENIVAFASPFDSESISSDQTNHFEDIIKISNDNFYSSAGVAQGIFGSNDIKQGTALQFSSMVDFAYVSTHIYPQFDNLVNWILWSKTGQYKFKVKFFGNKLTNQKDSADYATMVRTANMPAQKLFAYEGYEPFEVMSMLKLEKHLQMKEFMIPLVSAFNTSTEDAGRNEENNISESGEATRDYESNEE